MKFGLVGLLAGSCFACRAEPNPPLTQVIVLVGGDATVSALDVRIYGQAGTLSSARRINLEDRAPGRLPTSFTVIPAAHGNEASFRLRVTGYALDANGGVREVARNDVSSGFEPERTTLLPIVLSTACADPLCNCTDHGPCAQTCRATLPDPATCAPVPHYRRLPEVDAGQELEALGQGLAGCAKGSVPGPDGGCEDLDECAFYLDACDVSPHACVNLLPAEGYYRCACPPGFLGSGEADDPCRSCDGGVCAG